MSIQKNLKKGFTLIELMVVIVIIGILAAVAIPKLFGMSAKAKASEVGPAASTWVKMQTAYGMERDAYGSFAQIGYTPPPTGSFAYTEVDASPTFTWVASNEVKLNDCVPNNKWELKAEFGKGKPIPSIGGEEATYKLDTSCTMTADDDCMIVDKNAISGKPECENLTPSFMSIANIAG